MSEWQPIETAPKDGTPILAYGEPHSGEPPFGVVRWIAETHEWWERVDAKTKKLVSEEAGYWDGAGILPSFWMPLPAPPAPDGGRGLRE
jgi:hypothetical protein